MSILNLDVFVFYILFYALLFLHFDSVFGTKTKGDDRRVACIDCCMLNLGKLIDRHVSTGDMFLSATCLYRHVSKQQRVAAFSRLQFGFSR